MSNASIGKIGGKPYIDQVNDRLKGFLTGQHSTLDSVQETLGGVASSLNGESRVTIRLLVGGGVSSGALCELSVEGLVCEAVVPVASCGVGAIAYFGWNRDDRMTRPELASAQSKLLQTAMIHQLQERSLPPSYSVECWWPGQFEWSEQDTRDLLEIYQAAFTGYLVDFTEESIQGMLAGNLVAVARDHGHVVAVVMAEVATLPLEAGEISLAEISEVAVHPHHLGRGLARILYVEVVAALRDRHIDVIFTEARANLAAIMVAARGAGLSPRGLLRQHCVISSPLQDVPQDGKYGDLVVFSL